MHQRPKFEARRPREPSVSVGCVASRGWVSFSGGDALKNGSSMPEEDEEPEAEGEEVEGEGEDGEPKPPSLPIPGAEDQFEQLNELLRNNQVCCARLPRGAVDVALQTIGPRVA